MNISKHSRNILYAIFVEILFFGILSWDNSHNRDSQWFLSHHFLCFSERLRFAFQNDGVLNNFDEGGDFLFLDPFRNAVEHVLLKLAIISEDICSLKPVRGSEIDLNSFFFILDDLKSELGEAGFDLLVPGLAPVNIRESVHEI